MYMDKSLIIHVLINFILFFGKTNLISGSMDPYFSKFEGSFGWKKNKNKKMLIFCVDFDYQ